MRFIMPPFAAPATTLNRRKSDHLVFANDHATLASCCPSMLNNRFSISFANFGRNRASHLLALANAHVALQSSCALYSCRFLTARYSAPNNGASSWPAVAKAHAVLAMFWGLK
eukprot:gnl/MRDRNA2_/MRDRNA2_86551_c7_seq5.p1 gnl/MRDRNA2_/MRDRNA2_86551_c7~~gnl/MRDRNA2_/MRDRNA2_86551_c7_seq5.p1  ORF type:complete len:113 (-),score=10.26 gnl/MRDRNA2_/MRDRNA2_86551_c7_seq5:81-419(-)